MTGPLVVVGDVLLDVDVIGAARRLAPDAPVPVLDELREQDRPGGAGLAALLAAGHGRDVVLVAPMASDDAAARVRELLAERVDIVALPWAGRTPVKTRLRAGGQTVARLDRGGGPAEIGAMPAGVAELMDGAAAILVSDYGTGATASPVLRELLSAHAARVPVIWDPHPRGGRPVPGARLVTPNAAEAAAQVPEVSGTGIGAWRARAEALVARWHAGAVVVTRGADGALLSLGGGASAAFPVDAVAGTDTCGAGDCFAAAAALAMAHGALPSEAVGDAVRTAAAYVRSGAAAALDLVVSRHGYPDTGEPDNGLDDLLARVRAGGGQVVATGGCFDLLHAGHVATLQAARTLGDCLVVCLNSDDSVRRLKGDARPLQPQDDRGRVLAALGCVDAVVVFGEDTPAEVLRRVRPDVWVKGGDYVAQDLPEAAVLRAWGGEVVTVPYLAGRSTSGLVGLARR